MKLHFWPLIILSLYFIFKNPYCLFCFWLNSGWYMMLINLSYFPLVGAKDSTLLWLIVLSVFVYHSPPVSFDMPPYIIFGSFWRNLSFIIPSPFVFLFALLRGSGWTAWNPRFCLHCPIAGITGLCALLLSPGLFVLTCRQDLKERCT